MKSLALPESKNSVWKISYRFGVRQVEKAEGNQTFGLHIKILEFYLGARAPLLKRAHKET